MRLSVHHPRAEQAAFRARWLMVSPDRILENHWLETRNGRVAGISTTPAGPDKQDLGEGLIMPLLVNAHTHLELSALKKRTNCHKGFEAWVQEVIAKREAAGPAELAAAAVREVRKLAAGGTGAVAEISTLGLTRELLADSGLGGIWFQEVLGSRTDFLSETDVRKPDAGSDAALPPLGVSLAGHAPHTTSPELLRIAKAATRAQGLPFSIHLAESEAESDFINGENKSWEGFLRSRGIDVAGWPIGNKSPVAYLDELGLLDDQTLAVHLIRTTGQDLDILAARGTRVCLCPRSNQSLHQALPDIQGMLDRGITPALGTDSLASCDSLSLFDEMAFVRAHYPALSPETLLSMAGINGAKALGLFPAMGQLDINNWAGFLYVDLDARTPSEILECLTCNDT